jgi:hypothetical protein
MNAPGRLALYAAGAALAFAGAFGIAAVVVPDGVAASWNEGGTMKDHDAMGSGAPSASLPGLSLSEGGYALSPVAAPARVGEAGELSFRILAADGTPLTGFAESHEKDLHLITVRADGAQFRHVHPTLDPGTGTWSLPWQWAEAGTYRVYADFTPGGDATEGRTLSRTVQVAGDYAPVAPEPTRVSEVDGFTATVSGDLVAGATGELTISIFRDGKPVTALEPYLGAFGHLVALRDGDLAYLHVHPRGDEPEPGQTSGPDIAFAATAPTAGRYLLYLDFQVDGQVRTAEFVLDAAASGGTAAGEHEDDGSHGH